MRHNYWAWDLEPRRGNYQRLCTESLCLATREATSNEKPVQQTKSSSHFLQLEKVHLQQGRPRTSKNNKINWKKAEGKRSHTFDKILIYNFIVCHRFLFFILFLTNIFHSQLLQAVFCMLLFPLLFLSFQLFLLILDSGRIDLLYVHTGWSKTQQIWLA